MAVAMMHRDTTVSVIGKAITASDYASKIERAKAAFALKDIRCKDINFTGSNDPQNNNQGNKVTSCAIYNATGDPIALIVHKDWNGQVRNSYPTVIENGQMGFFVHTNRAMIPEGSKGAVVYRIKNANGIEKDWMSAWDNPPQKLNCTTHAYTEIQEPNYFTDKTWPTIYEKLKTAGKESTVTVNGCTGAVCIIEVPGGPARFNAVVYLDC